MLSPSCNNPAPAVAKTSQSPTMTCLSTTWYRRSSTARNIPSPPPLIVLTAASSAASPSATSASTTNEPAAKPAGRSSPSTLKMPLSQSTVPKPGGETDGTVGTMEWTSIRPNRFSHSSRNCSQKSLACTSPIPIPKTANTAIMSMA